MYEPQQAIICHITPQHQRRCLYRPVVRPLCIGIYIQVYMYFYKAIHIYTCIIIYHQYRCNLPQWAIEYVQPRLTTSERSECMSSSHIWLQLHHYAFMNTCHTITHIIYISPHGLMLRNMRHSRPSSVVERVIRNHKVEGSIPPAGYIHRIIVAHHFGLNHSTPLWYYEDEGFLIASTRLC